MVQATARFQCGSLGAATLSLALAAPARAGDVPPPTTTVITHGFSADGKGAWVEAMAAAVLARAGGDGAVYRYADDVGGLVRVPEAGGNGSSRNSVIVFNWAAESASVAEGPNWRYAQAAGDVMYAVLRGPSYVAGSSGPADLASGRRVHLLGHSRGACVVSEAARRFAAAGIPIDQMTTFDPHPVNGTLDARYDLDWGDPVPQRWSNVAWADNFWRADGGGLVNGLDFDGIPLQNVLNLQLSESTLNCCAYSLSHSDVHLWYHGTIDLAAGASNGEQAITAQMRSSWWPQGAAQSGFFRSAIAGGARPAIPPGVDPPAGSAPLLWNGGFESGSRSGWSGHGGSGATLASASGNWFARLTSARPRLIHNRAYLPAPASALRPLRFLMNVRRSGTGGPDDVLRVELERPGDPGPLGIPGGAWPVAGLPSSFVRLAVDVPAGFTGRTLLVHVAIDGGSDGVGSTVELDDLELAFAPPPGDVTGDGRVDGQDIAALLSAWGPCSSCAADLNLDGSIDGMDLVVLLSDWG